MLFESTREYGKVFAYILKLLPSVLISSSILDITNAEQYALFEGRSTNIDHFEWENSGKNIFYMFLDFFIYLGVLVAYEYYSNRRIRKQDI